MPELPEVETTRRGIEPALVGHRVLGMVVRDRRLRWPIEPRIEDHVRGATALAVERRAKYLLMRFTGGTAIVHLGMSGSLRLLPAATLPLAHDHWDLVLDSGQVLRFHDPRRFGSLHWTAADPAAHPLLCDLGPEPLSADFDGETLFRASRHRRVAIKLLIMNAHVVVGVGNIYASEALFRARIRPTRAAQRLTRREAGALAASIREVLAGAIAIGGTTLRDYVNADGVPGYFRQQLFVYERAGEPCRVCGTGIRQITQGQRSTYYCPQCQP
jgi:formamidopyrimidine-DNA glycosylase